LASGAGTILSGFSLMMLNRWRLRVAPDFPQSVTEGVKPYKSDGGHKPWTPAQCAAAEKNFTGMVRRAYFLARYTGQRGSDVVRLAETFIDDGGFRLIQKKTGREVWCPIDEALAAEMAT
jgi:integrase